VLIKKNFGISPVMKFKSTKGAKDAEKKRHAVEHSKNFNPIGKSDQPFAQL
jgi:hypothetical protein